MIKDDAMHSSVKFPSCTLLFPPHVRVVTGRKWRWDGCVAGRVNKKLLILGRKPVGKVHLEGDWDLFSDYITILFKLRRILIMNCKLVSILYAVVVTCLMGLSRIRLKRPRKTTKNFNHELNRASKRVPAECMAVTLLINHRARWERQE
jgi:hypothetical protein